MNIIMFGHKVFPSRTGGVEVVVQELCTRMAEQGHSVLCCNRREQNTESKTEHKGVKICTVPTIRRKGLSALSASFFAAFRAAFSNCEIVHIHGEGPAFFSFLPKLMGKAVIVTVHGLDWDREKWKGTFASRFLKWGEQIAVNVADEMIVLSRSAEQYFYNTYGRKTVYLPNGCAQVNVELPKLIRENWGLEKDSYLLFVGRLVPEKGIHYLIEAFKTVETSKKLVIVGSGSDSDEYVAYLYDLAKEDRRILFTGFAKEDLLCELYSNAYVYVLPSSLEGMPLTLVEAMSYGNCCVVSNIPECREVVGNSGICISVGSEEMAECLRKLCNSSDEVEKYKRAALNSSQQMDDWDKITEQTLKLYERVLSRRYKNENTADQ